MFGSPNRTPHRTNRTPYRCSVLFVRIGALNRANERSERSLRSQSWTPAGSLFRSMGVGAQAGRRSSDPSVQVSSSARTSDRRWREQSPSAPSPVARSGSGPQIAAGYLEAAWLRGRYRRPECRSKQNGAFWSCLDHSAGLLRFCKRTRTFSRMIWAASLQTGCCSKLFLFVPISTNSEFGSKRVASALLSFTNSLI